MAFMVKTARSVRVAVTTRIKREKAKMSNKFKPLTPEELKTYECSKHGGIGNPSCPECWENLARLLERCNAYAAGVPNGKIEP
jgi:hypothetical protein